jgi:hypothetical protein
MGGAVQCRAGLQHSDPNTRGVRGKLGGLKKFQGECAGWYFRVSALLWVFRNPLSALLVLSHWGADLPPALVQPTAQRCSPWLHIQSFPDRRTPSGVGKGVEVRACT